MFILSLTASVLLLAAMHHLDRMLITPSAPMGILSFEFAGNSEQASRILRSWDDRAQHAAALSLVLDYFFLAAYALFLTLACQASARRFKSQATWLLTGTLLAWAQYLAAGLDALENMALLQLLQGSSHALWPQTAAFSAAVKFSLIAAAWLYIVAGLLGRLIVRLTK